MSNNIYDILKKFNSLDSVKNMLSEGKKVCKDCGKAKCECVNESKGSKPDFLDMDKDGDTNEPMKKAAKDKSKGAIAEAVARVEQNLAEKYMGFKKTVDAIKKSGSADNPEAVAASIGRKKYGKDKFQKAAAAGKKLGEGEYNEDMLSPGQKKIARMSPPPNKIDANDLAALRAGKKKKAEGNAFSGAVAKAKASGQDEFEVGGKEYEVQEGIEDTLQNILPKSMQPFNNQTAAAASKAQAPVKEGFPTVDDAKKRMDAKAGKTAHGTKTVTKTGVKHERNYDADEPTGERGRPKKDKFAK
jgi:hypothetical protein